MEEVTAADGPASRRQQQQQQQQQPKQQQPPPKQHQKPQQQQQVPHFVQRAYDLVVAAVEDAVDCGSDPRLASGKLLAAAAKNTTTDVLCSAGLTVLAYMLPFSTGKAVPAQLVNVKGDGNCQVSAIVVAMGKPEPGIKAVEKFRTASTNALEARIKKPVMAARDLEVEGKDLLLGECRGGEKTADHVIKRLNKPWEYLEQASLYGASIHLGVTIIVFNARQPPQVIRTAGVRPQGRMVAIASFEEEAYQHFMAVPNGLDEPMLRAYAASYLGDVYPLRVDRAWAPLLAGWDQPQQQPQSQVPKSDGGAAMGKNEAAAVAKDDGNSDGEVSGRRMLTMNVDWWSTFKSYTQGTVKPAAIAPPAPSTSNATLEAGAAMCTRVDTSSAQLKALLGLPKLAAPLQLQQHGASPAEEDGGGGSLAITINPNPCASPSRRSSLSSAATTVSALSSPAGSDLEASDDEGGCMTPKVCAYVWMDCSGCVCFGWIN